jgi:uncharacterized repeat protein (TIGR01451 family)
MIRRKVITCITYSALIAGLVLCLFGVALRPGSGQAQAATGNIDSTDKWAWSTNAGWINLRPEHGGVTVYSDHLEGYAWAENVGWIRLGSDGGGGTPYYANTTAGNYGVNNDGSGNLSGYAWSTNVGWINFNPSHSQVTIDTDTGRFEGYAWSENVGWIHFSSPYGVVTSGGSIDPTDKYAWDTNAGWVNFRPTHGGGVAVYDDHLEGYAWAENIGWIRLGTHTGGSPHTYLNTTKDNYGVNRDGSGNLSGYAWSTNAGWINFDPTHSQVTIDPDTGRFDGYAWGENVGWIHFDGPYSVGTTYYPIVPDLIITKSNDGTPITLGSTWEWRLVVTNNGNDTASFSNGDTILSDQLPTTNVSYGDVTVDNETGIGGTIGCSISGGGLLTCTANGAVTIDVSPGTFRARFTATPTAVGAFTNPTGGSCSVDPNDGVSESSETNNDCNSDAVTVNAPDLTVTKSKTSPAGDPVVGQNWTWRLAVTNGGTANAVFPGAGATVLQDTFPTGPSYTDPGAIALDAGSMNCTFTGNQLNCLTVAANATINSGSTFNVDVTSNSAAAGAFNNTAADCTVDTGGVVTESNEGNNNCAADNSVTVLAHPTMTKVFSGVGTGLAPNGGDPTIPLNGVSTLTFNITNPNASASLSGLNFTDPLPAGLQLANPVNQGGTCPAPVFTPALAPGGTAINLTGSGALAAASSCTITVDVQGTTTGLKNNTTGTVNSAETGTGTSTASDSLLVLSYPTITKAIAPDPVAVGTPTTVTFTINNPNATSGLNGLNFTDALPAGMTIATPPNQGGTCPAPVFTPALAGGGNAINLTGSDTLAASVSCTLTVEVVGSPDGSYTNTTGAVGSSQTGSGASTGSDIVIVRDFPTISKVFAPAMITPGEVSTLTFTIVNPNTATYTLSGLNFTDTLPAGVQLANPVNQGGTCPAPVFAPALAPGGTQVNLTGSGVLGLSSSCTIAVDVTSAVVGIHNNTTGVVGSAETGAGTDDAAATLTVNPADLVITKTVDPSTANPGDPITYTIAFTNTGLGLASGVVITDVVPVSVTVTSVISSGVAITDTGTSPPYVWEVADLAVGQGGVITITGQLSPTLATGTFTNTAVITTTTVDANHGNNRSDVEVTVIAGGTVETATGTGTADFRINSGRMEDLAAVAEGTLTCPEAGKPDLVFTHGFFSFNITGLTPCAGETVVVTITLPSAVPATTQYWKCHDGAWLDVTSLLGDNDGDNVLTLTLTDGGLGDDDGECNGVIVDDGGPGQQRPIPVGGLIVPVSKLGLLVPWLALASLAALTVALVRGHRSA